MDEKKSNITFVVYKFRVVFSRMKYIRIDLVLYIYIVDALTLNKCYVVKTMPRKVGAISGKSGLWLLSAPILNLKMMKNIKNSFCFGCFFF